MSEILWDQYNARGLTPEMVASTFVAPSQFALIDTPRNTVILGARGSGKTTILRMFEPRAQVSWARQKGAVTTAPMLGIFVPVDASWLASLQQTVEGAAQKVDWNQVALCIYSLAVARAVVDVLIYRAKDEAGLQSSYGVSLHSDDELKWCKEVSSLLSLTNSGASLRDLRFQITSDLAQFPQRAIRLTEGERSALFAALSDPVLIAATACDLFNTLVGETGRKWLLLCDEIEIAPAIVRDRLFRSLRATPPPLVVKLALTPIVRGVGRELAEQPLPGHDYDPVSLSYASKDDGGSKKAREDFCIAIWTQMCRERFGNAAYEIINPFRMLLEPNLSESIRRRGARQRKQHSGPEERYGPLFIELCKIDASFEDYLLSKGVKPERLDLCTPEQFDAVVRKVAPLAELRLFFFSGASSGRLLAGRRSPVIYAGARKLFQMSEGHPRWLKSTIGSLLTKVDKRGRISLASQAAEIRTSTERLLSRTRAVPAQTTDASAIDLLEKLGSFFNREVLGERFKADPVLSFRVDENISEGIVRAVEDCLFIGALVPMSEEVGGLMQDGVIGKRLRLSNWLAPHFRLPLITGKAVSLSRALESEHNEAQLGLGV